MPSTTLPGVGRARDERHEPQEPATVLLEGHVDHRLHVALEAHLTDVSDHAHHRQPLAAIEHVHAHAPAERLARTTGKAFAHDALADDPHLHRGRRVLGRELASCQQRNFHGLEIARLDLRRAGKKRRLRLPLDLEVALDEHPAERHRVDQARGRHARQGLDAIEDAAGERMDAFGLAGEAFGQHHPHGLHDAVAAARFEAGRHRRETHEAVNQQPRADQQDERHRDLPGDQQRPQPLALAVARRRAPHPRATRALRQTRLR